MGWPSAMAPPETLVLAHVDVEEAGAGQRLGGEGLVQLDQVHLVEGHAGLLQDLERGVVGAHAHVGRVERGRGVADHAGQGLQAALLGELARGDAPAPRPRR